MNFGYTEKNQKKNALVKVSVCKDCAFKLNYKKALKKLSWWSIRNWILMYYWSKLAVIILFSSLHPHHFAYALLQSSSTHLFFSFCVYENWNRIFSRFWFGGDNHLVFFWRDQFLALLFLDPYAHILLFHLQSQCITFSTTPLFK